MSNKIEVKVNLLEFTYKDKKGYHTVVGYGYVPADNHEVKEALSKGWIEEVKTKTAFDDNRKGRKSRKDSASGNKEE